MSESLVSVLVEALLHSLWQSAILMGLLWSVLRTVPAKSTDLRYGFCLSALVIAVVLVPVTISILLHGNEPGEVSPPTHSSVESFENSNETIQTFIGTNPSFSRIPHASTPLDWPLLILWIWMGGVLLGLIRLVKSVHGAIKLRSGAIPAPAGPFASMSDTLNFGRVVPVLSSNEVSIASVCGWLKPAVLIPASLFTCLTPLQLEAVIAHELAHIRRRDHWVNFFQCVAETFLFFNPFFRWISALVRHEREACCDAIAVQISGQPQDYLRTLLKAANPQSSPCSTLMPAFLGDLRVGSLADRVRRLVYPAVAPDLRMRISTTLGLLVVSGLALLSVKMMASAVFDVFTPEQRIAAVEEVHANYPQHAIDRIEPNSEGAPRSVVLAGRIELPEGIDSKTPTIHLKSESFSYTYMSSFGADRNGRFRNQIRSGRIELLFQVEGCAPVYRDLGIVSENLQDLAITMKPGKNGILRCVNEQGEPLAGVLVNYRINLGPQGTNLSSVSDESGHASLPDVAGFPLSMELRLPNFQRGIWADLIVPEEGVRQMVLSEAKPLQVLVLDKSTGEPISNAQFRLGNRTRQGKSANFANSSTILATTDRSGAGKVTELRDDSLYYFNVSAKGYVGTVVGPVVAGEKLEARLIPSTVKPIRITGLSKELLDEEDRIEIRCSHTVQYGSRHAQGLPSHKREIKVVNGEVSFDYQIRWEGDLKIAFGEFEYDFGWVDLLDNEPIHIALGKQGAESEGTVVQMRPVEIHVQTPTGEPLANGRIAVGYIRNGIRSGQTRIGETLAVEVRDGWARIEVPVPNDLSISSEGLQGYWFKRPFQMEVAAADLSIPARFELETKRAGAIAGRLLEADGTGAKGALIGIFRVEQKGRQYGNSLSVSVKDISSPDDDSHQFLASPLPLDETYVVVAHRDFTYAHSAPVKLSEGKPVETIVLQIPKGDRFRGRLVNRSGEGIRMMNSNFVFSPHKGNSYSRRGPVSSDDGRFVIEGINLDVDGAYYLEVDTPGYLTKRYGLRPDEKEQILRLEPGQKIHGVVLEADTGRVIPGAEVYATRNVYDKDAFPFAFETSKTNAQGQFEFTNLPAGEFRINSRSGSFPSKSAPIATAGQNSEVTLEINLYEWSKLRPSAPKSE